MHDEVELQNKIIDDVLDKGFAVHATIKAQLIKVINGEEEANPHIIKTDNNCIVGDWLYGPGSEFEDLPEYQALKEIHAQFHVEAYNALILNKTGKTTEANDYISSGPFELQSQKMKAAFRALKQAISKRKE